MEKNVPSWIIVHHTAVRHSVNPDQFNATNEYHKSLDFPLSSLGFYCGYHFELPKNGVTHQARLVTEVGAHTKGMNASSIGICLDGNFDIEAPTAEQEESLIQLVKKYQEMYKIPSSHIVPHRVFANKSCYGSRLSDSWARVVLQQRLVPDSLLRRWLELFVKAKVITEPKLNLLFGSSDFDAPCNGYII